MIDPRPTAQDRDHPTTAELKQQGHLLNWVLLTLQLIYLIWIIANHMPLMTWLVIEAVVIVCVVIRSR